MAEEKERSIGGIWRNSAGDKEYLSIQLDIDGVKHKLVAFKNKFKKEDKHPDFSVFISRPKGSSPQPQQEPPAVDPKVQAEVDDIPF